VEAVLFLAHPSAGTENVGKAVVVINISTPQGFDAAAGFRNGAAGFAADDDLVHRQILLDIQALLNGGFPQIPGVGRGGPDGGGLELLQDGQQFFRGQGARVDREGAQLLGSQDAGTADEEGKVQGVAVPVRGAQAAGPELASFVIDPVVKVLGREGGGGGYPGGAAGSGDIDDVPFRHGDQIAKGRHGNLPVPHQLFVDKGEAAQVIQVFDLVRMDPGGVPGAVVVGGAQVSVAQVALEQIQFESIPIGPALGLQLLIPVGGIGSGGLEGDSHDGVSCGCRECGDGYNCKVSIFLL